MRRTARLLAGAVALLALALAALGPAGAAADTVPANFEAQTVFAGINKPVNFKFAPDGRVFVATKGGKIWVYDSLADQTPTLFANLSKPVYDYDDHGLLGLALDPGFDLGRPYVYALYTYNHKLANKATQVPQVTNPKAEPLAWPGYKGVGPEHEYEEDKCPEGEEKAEGKIPKELIGCEVSGILVRLTAGSNDEALPSAAAPEEKVLLEGWCQQATTHSIGDLGFGPEGALYVSGGEGGMFSEPDYGQFGNVCHDPPEPLNPSPDRIPSEGGSLRAQSLLRNHAEPGRATLLSGSILRIDPNTGAGWPGNPFQGVAGAEPNAERIIAFGYRNPWRFAIAPRLGSVFVDNVGNGAYEEMDRVPLGASTEFNSGWPCYEGGPSGVNRRNTEYSGGKVGNEDFTLAICEHQFEEEEAGRPQTKPPFFSYQHSGPIAPGESCPTATTDIAGLAFYEASAYPAAYRDSLFFGDAIRGCIYVMHANAECEPDPGSVTPFLSGTAPFSFPGVDIEQGPEGNIFYAEMSTGAIKRIVYHGPAEPAPPNGGGPACPRVDRGTGGGMGAGGSSPGPAPAPSYEPPKLGKHPAKKTTSRTAKFAFSTAGAPKFQCRIDKKKWASCKSPRTYRRLAPGSHTFRVRAAGADGAPLTKATAYSWRIVSS